MKRVIVFRFHKLPDICVERVSLLKRVNPSIDIFGLYGGERDELSTMQRALRPLLEDIFSLAEYAPAWKWRFSDLALREWFISVGVHVPFDVAHVVEWDLLLCRPLERMYSHIAGDSIGLTAIRPVKDVASTYSFTAEEPFSLEWKKLLAWAKSTHSYAAEPLVCLGPGWCVPRLFLEAYSKFVVPEISIDELRLPLSAQLLGMRLSDTRLCRSWYLEDELKVFNTYKKEVLVSTVAQELAQPRGRRAFHPFRAHLAQAVSFPSQELVEKLVA